MIGFGMLGRAELFFVVLNLCYVDNKIMHKEMFYTFTFAAMFLNITVPVCITLYKPYYVRSKKLKTGTGLKRSGTVERAASFFRDTISSAVLMRKAKGDEINAERRVFQASPNKQHLNGLNGTKPASDASDGEVVTPSRGEDENTERPSPSDDESCYKESTLLSAGKHAPGQIQEDVSLG
jgi:hypothetical protein